MAELFRALACLVIRRSLVQSLHSATNWICSRSFRVQILGHAFYIANWSASCRLRFLTMFFVQDICFLCFSGMPVN